MNSTTTNAHQLKRPPEFFDGGTYAAAQPDKEAHLFPVALEPIFTRDGVQVPKKFSVVRQDTRVPLSVVSDRYLLVTHGQALAQVKPFTDALGEATVKHFLESNGARLVSRFTYKDRTVEIPAVNDVVALELNITNSYDGHSPLKYSLASRVLRCLNGMTIVGGELEFSWRHTGMDHTIILPDPEKVLAHFKKAANTWDLWARTPLILEDRLKLMSQILALHVLTEGQVKKWESDFNQTSTVWELYDRFTYVITHEFPRLRESSRLHKLAQLQFAFDTYKQTAVS